MFGQKFLKIRSIALRPVSIAAADKRRFNSFGNGGERKLLTRSIDLDPFDLTIEEKIFRGAKRACIAFAITALTISALDLMDVRSVEAAAQFIHDNRLRLADLPDAIRSGIQSISIVPTEQQMASVAVKIPSDEILKTSRPLSVAPSAIAAKPDASPVAALAAARHEDAIEAAMASPAAWSKP